MKTIICIVSLVPLLFLTSCSSHTKPEDLAHAVLDAFKSKDVDMALEYLLNEDDYKDFYSNSTLKRSEKKRLIDKQCNSDYVQERKKRFKKRFKEIIEKGEKLGIVWKNVKFESIQGPNKNKNYEGMQSDEIYVFFSYNSRTYKLTLDDCYRTSRGWLMSDEPRLHGTIGK